ncbi:hypothetical protein AVEN_62133-1 [Araneus ventricosus]|uniref:Uncharacterized protein n=1 Tax=Araneus ventricosus TaxID=182803 RepID=A0A4Y2CYT1_ARAVE|nr:hypothetical protein AVEN_62133-1 [Araneus ventricosus]
MFWGFTALRNSTSRTAGGRIPTQDAYAITTARRNCTEDSADSTSFDLPIIYRCFSSMLQPSHKPSGYWNRVALRCKVELQYSSRFFDSFRSPRKDGRNCIPLCRKGAVLVRDGYKRRFFLSFL